MQKTMSRCLWNTICDNKKASCEALFLMGSVDIVLPSRDSARIANLQIDTAKIWTFLFTPQVFWWKKVKTVVTAAAIFRFSHGKCGRTADLAIAYWKKQIVLCPYINDIDKEWCKEFVEKMTHRLVPQQTIGRSKTPLLTQFSWSTFI